MDAIFKRRSIRVYEDKIIPDDAINKLLKAGMAAPSAGNSQTWHFIVVEDRNMINNITMIHPHAQMLREASHAIIVCGETDSEGFDEYWIQDCSAATQNIMLMATKLGIGSVWLGVHPIEIRVKDIKKLFNIPRNVRPLSIISLGYPGEEKEPNDRFLLDRIHKNTW